MFYISSSSSDIFYLSTWALSRFITGTDVKSWGRHRYPLFLCNTESFIDLLFSTLQELCFFTSYKLNYL